MGMILDGVAASEAVDSSGEILDVEGCDISDLVNGTGVLNYEHRGDDAPGASANDIVGKIIFAKKVFKRDDCDTDREREYWDKVKLPFIYIKAELFDGEGHPGAIAAAALIRYYHTRKEPILARYSIEGSTIEKKGNTLLVSMARRVALTIKPCNRTALSGVVSDGKEDTKKSEFEHPERMRLGGEVTENGVGVLNADFAQDIRANLQKLDKAMAAGSYNVAPGSLSGGAALQVEDLHGIHKSILVAVKSAIRDWAGEGGKERLGELVKFYLPEASDEFINHFQNLVDDWTVKKREMFLQKGAVIPFPTMAAKPAVDQGAPAPVQRIDRPQGHGGAKRSDDYSHLLPDEARAAGYRAFLDHSGFTIPGSADGYASARLMLNGKKVGSQWHYPSPTDESKYRPGTLGVLEGHEQVASHLAAILNDHQKKYRQAWQAHHAPTFAAREEERHANAIDTLDDRTKSGTRSIKQAFKPRNEPMGKQEAQPEKLVLEPTPGEPVPAPADMKQKDGGIARDPKGVKRLQFQIGKEKDGSERATLHTRKESYILYNPGSHISQDYEKALKDPETNRIHDEAMKNWVVLHRLAREGKLPEHVIAHAALFSAMSPNTPVPVQELAYGFLMDMRRRGWDPTKSLNPDQRKQWEEEFQKFAKGYMLPQYMHDHFSSKEAGIHIANDQSTKGKGGIIIPRVHWTGETPDEGEYVDQPKHAGDRGDVGLAKQKAAGALNYADMHGLLAGLIAQHGVDGRAVAAHLNNLKHQGALGHLGDEDPEVSGFAPKTIRYTLGMLGLGNVHVPDTHLIRHLFGLPLGDERSDKLKGVLWDAKNEGILGQIDQWYYRNHPAVQHARQKLKEQYGEDFGEQSIFPGFWLHWLTIEPHERLRNWAVKAKNAGTDHSVFFNSIFNLLDEYGVPYRHHLRKSEGWTHDEGSLAARCAHVTKILHDRFGYTPATLAYYAYIVPALLGNTQMLNKAEALKTRVLRKGEQAPGDVANFRGHYVVPGEIVEHNPAGTQKYKLLHVDDMNHYVEDQWKNRRAVANTNVRNGYYTVGRLPQKLRGNMQLDHSLHTLPGLAEGEEQKALIHGMDLAEPGRALLNPNSSMHGEISSFRKSGNGTLGFVKPGGYEEIKVANQPFTVAQREAAFYHLAKNVFGMGQYVPPTAAFRHPISGEHHSVMQALPNAQHYNDYDSEHNGVLHRLGLAGELHKLGMMDSIMGQQDRHIGNWMMHDGNLKLIDNGYSFGRGPMDELEWPPTYMEKFDKTATPHPEAIRWVNSIDPKHLESEAQRIGVPQRYIQEMLRRLDTIKRSAARNPNQSAMDLVHAPFNG